MLFRLCGKETPRPLSGKAGETTSTIKLPIYSCSGLRELLFKTSVKPMVRCLLRINRNSQHKKINSLLRKTNNNSRTEVLLLIKRLKLTSNSKIRQPKNSKIKVKLRLISKLNRSKLKPRMLQ